MFSLFSSNNNIEDINNDFFGKNQENQEDQENQENQENQNYLYQIINNNLIFKKHLISIIEYINTSNDNNYNDLIENIHKHVSLPEDNDLIILPDNFKLNTITDSDIKYKFFHNKSDIPNDFDIEKCKKNMAKYYLYIYLIINIFYKQVNDDNNLNDIINTYIPDYNIRGGGIKENFNTFISNVKNTYDTTINKRQESIKNLEQDKELHKESNEKSKEKFKEELEKEIKQEKEEEGEEQANEYEDEYEDEDEYKNEYKNGSVDNDNDNGNDNDIYGDINRFRDLDSNVVLNKFNNKSSIKKLIDYLKDLINKESIDIIDLSNIVNNIENNINLYKPLVEDEKFNKRIKEMNSNDNNNYINNNTNNNKYFKKLLKETLNKLVDNNNSKNIKIYNLLKNNIINIREKDNTDINKNLTFKTLKTTLNDIINILIETEIFVYDKILFIIDKSKQL